MDVDQFFADWPDSGAIFDAVEAAARAQGTVELAVSKSQIVLKAGKAFAWVWAPRRYLRGVSAPLVLTFSFRERREWDRWKEIYQAAPKSFTHHLELWSVDEVDEEVSRWLQEARDAVRQPPPATHEA